MVRDFSSIRLEIFIEFSRPVEIFLLWSFCTIKIKINIIMGKRGSRYIFFIF